MFKFCSDGNCCSTGGIKLRNGNDNSFDCATADWFEDSKLGSCKGLRLDQESDITGQVSYSSLTQSSYNGWHGDWIKLISKDGIIFKCAVEGWIDSDNQSCINTTCPISWDFICKVQVWCAFMNLSHNLYIFDICMIHQ